MVRAFNFPYDIKNQVSNQQQSDIMREKKDPSVSSPETDSESGAERLNTPEDQKRRLYALKSMYDRGLIPEEEYQAQLKD